MKIDLLLKKAILQKGQRLEEPVYAINTKVLVYSKRETKVKTERSKDLKNVMDDLDKNLKRKVEPLKPITWKIQENRFFRKFTKITSR